MTEKDLENCKNIITYLTSILKSKNLVAESLWINIATINSFWKKDIRYTTIEKIYKWYNEIIKKIMNHPKIIF